LKPLFKNSFGVLGRYDLTGLQHKHELSCSFEKRMQTKLDSLQAFKLNFVEV